MRRLKLVLYWLLVAIPLGWGMYRSIQKAMPLLISSSAERPQE